jgi:hypothetical protein
VAAAALRLAFTLAAGALDEPCCSALPCTIVEVPFATDRAFETALAWVLGCASAGSRAGAILARACSRACSSK